MKRDALIFAVSGTFFGLLVGWILGTQRAAPAAPPPAATSAAASSSQPGQQQAPPLDVQRATDLERQAKARPADAGVRVELANVYYDAERYDLAIPWYEAALKLDPNNVSVSTDLAICYYYTNDPDRALKQIDASLALAPNHAKTLLNQGIIRAWGKQDLKGAAEAWDKVIQVAPNSEEARRAKLGLDGINAAHAGTPAAGTGAGAAPGGAGSRP